MPASPCSWHKPRKTNISTPNTCQGRYLGEEMLVALRSKSTSPSPTSPSSVSAHASSDESVSDSSGRFSSSTFQAPIPWSVPEPPPSDFTPLFTEDSEIKPIVLNLNAGGTAPSRQLESIFKDLDLAEGTPLAASTAAAAAAAADGEGQRLTAGFGINSPEKNVDTARETDKKKKPAHKPVDHASAASGHYPGNGANKLNRNEEKEATSSKKPVRGGVQANKSSSQHPHDGTSISKRTPALPNSTTPATGILKHAQDKKQTTPHTRAPSHGTSSSSRVPQSTSMPKRSPTPARREQPRLTSSVAQHRTPSSSAQHRHWMTDLGSSSVPSAAVGRGRNNTPPCKSAGEQGTKGTSTSTLTSTTHPSSARGILKNTQQPQSISSAKEAGAHGSNSSCRAHSRGPSPAAANRPLPQGSSSRGTSAAPAPKPLASSSIITSTRARTPIRRRPAPLSSSLITSSNHDVSSSNKVDEKLSSRGKSGAAGTTARSGTPRAPSRTRSHSEASTMKTGKQTPSRNTSTTRTPWSANTSTEGLSFTMSKSSTGREPAGTRALHSASSAAPATRGVKPQTTRRTPSSSCVRRTTKEIDRSVGRTANNEVVAGDRSISRTPRRVVPPCVAENQGKTKQGGGAGGDTGARMRSGTPKAQGAAADAISRSLQRATASSRSGAAGSGYGSSRSPMVRRKKLEEIKSKAAETQYMAKGSTISPRGLTYAPPPSTDNAAKCGSSTAVVTNALVQSLMEAQKACTPRASEAWKERIRRSNTPSNSVHTPRYPRGREEDAAHHATTTCDGQSGEKNSLDHTTQRGALEEIGYLKKNGSSTISDTNKEAPISIKVNPASPGNALNVDDLCRRLSSMSIRSNSSFEDDARDPEHTPECPQVKFKGKLKKGGLMCLKIDTSDISHIDGQATTREEERILMSDERKERGSMIVHDARAATVDVVVDHKEKIHTKRSKDGNQEETKKKMEAAPVTTPSFACSSPDDPSPRSPIIIKPAPNTQVVSVPGRGAPEHSPHPGSSSNTLKTLKAARSERRFKQRSAPPGNSPIPIPSSRGTGAPAQAQSPLQPGGTGAEASSVTIPRRRPPHPRTPSRGSRRGEGKKKMEQKTLHNKDTTVINDLSDLLSPSQATYSCATPSDRLASPSLRGEADIGVNSSDINRSKGSKLHNIDQEQLIALRQCIDTLIRGEDLTSHIHLHELDRQRLNELKLLFGTKIDLDDDVRKERDWFYEKYVQTVDICRYIHDNTSNDRIPEAWGRLLAHLRSFSEE